MGSGATLTITDTTLNGSGSTALGGSGTVSYAGLSFSGAATGIATSTPTQLQGSTYGAQWPLIQTQTASNVASLAFTVNTNVYETYMLVWDNVQGATAGAVLQMQISNNGGSSIFPRGD